MTGKRATGGRKKKDRARLWKEETGVVVDGKNRRPGKGVRAGAARDAI